MTFFTNIMRYNIDDIIIEIGATTMKKVLKTLSSCCLFTVICILIGSRSKRLVEDEQHYLSAKDEDKNYLNMTFNLTSTHN